MLWARQLVTIIKKKNGKLTMRVFRPIAMLPTMYRFCSKVLQQLAGQAIHTRYGPQYGHVPGRQAPAVVFILRRMVEQANEWRIPIFVKVCDVAAAFDHVSHHLITDAMEALQVPPVFVEHFRCHKGIRVQRTCLGQRWMFRQQPLKWRLPIGGNYMRLLLFADSCWLIAMSPAELRCMACAWNELLGKAGLRIAWKEAPWCTSAPDSLAANIEVGDTVITRRSREQGFEALGAWITFDGHFVKELVEGEAIAWRSLHAIRHLSCDNKVELRHRLRLLSSCDTPSLHWCSGSRILTQSQCTHLRAIQDKMLKRMIYVPRSPTETPEAHMIRWSKLLHNCRRKHKILHGDEMYFASYFS